MKRLLGIVTITGLALVFMVLAVQWWGLEKGTTSVGSVPSVVEFWHLRDCSLPCWAGVEIGTTPLTVAYRRVQSLYAGYTLQGKNDSDRFELAIRNAEGHSLGEVLAFANVGIVQRITLFMRGNNRLRLGDSLAVYGQPSCAESSVIVVGYDTVVLEDLPNGLRVYNVVWWRDIQSPLEQLVFEHTNNARRLCGSVYKRWRGFTYP